MPLDGTFKLNCNKGSVDQENSRLGLGSNIVNLSSRDLSANERSLLDKGLKFIPAPTKIDHKVLSESVQKLGRTLKLGYFFSNGVKCARVKRFRKKSSWTPPDKSIHPKILEKISEMETKIKNLRIRHENPNLKKAELKALRRLKNDPRLIIKPADKGSATVVMDKADYIYEANRQLSNRQHYRKLDSPLYKKTSKKIDDVLKKLLKKHEIDKEEYEYFKPPSKPRERRFYLLPKIHKNIEKWTVPGKIPPGRPIVSDCDSDSYHISEYIDHILAPLATKHPAYIRDTKHFLDIISETKVPENSFLVTLDVDSLYTNIDNEAGMSAVKKAFQDNPIPSANKLRDRRPMEILDLLKICLENNDFVFNGEWYLQTSGTAMGKKFAPNYANIFMANWEKEALSKCAKQPLVYLRYLDDIFIIWTHSEADFQEFFETLNSQSASIKLKATIHPSQIDFLDVTIFKGARFSNTSILDSKVYFKPTDTHELLHKASFHPKHTFAGIIKSQILRFHRICNNESDFHAACNILFKALQSRHYSNRFLRGIKSQTLQEINEKMRLQGPQNGQIGPCGGKVCKTCKFIPKTNFFLNGTQKFRFNQNLNCNSKNVIYLIVCSHCDRKYVGETGNTVRERFNGHRRDVKNDIKTNVADHFFPLFGCEFETKCVLYPLEQIPTTGCETEDKQKRLERENYWIRKLHTYPPWGLNTGYDAYKDDPLPFVIKFSSASREASRAIRNIYLELQQEFIQYSIFPKKFITAYQRNKSMKDLLCSSLVRN